jgi:hypothetical protein
MMNTTTTDRITVNGTSYAVASRGAGLIQLTGSRGGEHVLVKNIRSGQWVMLQGGTRRVAIRTVEGLTATELAAPGDAAEPAPVFVPETSNHYAVAARKIRTAGFKCAIRCGEIIVWRPGTERCWFVDIDKGRWMNHGNLGEAPWRSGKLDEVMRPGLARVIESHCYCTSFPDGGCDFCNGTRSCDGEV